MACRPGFPPIWAVITIILQYDKGQSEKYLLKKREIHTLKKINVALKKNNYLFCIIKQIIPTYIYYITPFLVSLLVP